MKPQPTFSFTDEEREEINGKLKAYFLDELELEIGSLQTDLFIDFINEHIGKHYYNLGVTDTTRSIKEKLEDLVMLIKD